ncbi:MAG: DUF4303 domain-containing protein [Ruminococcus sp.]|nr:DUF4303 domain-containing protein [Ruminococcus sp.]
MNNYNEQLVCLLENATESTFKALLEKNEKFYYFSLLIDEGASPYVSAWSYEALENLFSELKSDDETEKLMYKWAICDSTYVGYEHDLYFNAVDEFLQKNDIWELSDDDFYSEFDVRLNSMEEALRRLDKKGLFGTGDDRKKIVITAEVVPPDYTNTARVQRLNPDDIIQEWLEFCSEPESE